MHLHIGAKLAGTHCFVFESGLLQQVIKHLVSEVGWGGGAETGAHTLAGISRQGKLGYE